MGWPRQWGCVVTEVGPSERIGTVSLRVHVRKWHPGYWLMLLKCLLHVRFGMRFRSLEEPCASCLATGKQAVRNAGDEIALVVCGDCDGRGSR